MDFHPSNKGDLVLRSPKDHIRRICQNFKTPVLQEIICMVNYKGTPCGLIVSGGILHFSGVFALGGDTNFNLRRAISPELSDLQPSFMYKNNSLNMLYNTKQSGCISPNRCHNNVRVGGGTLQIFDILPLGGHY